MKKIYLILIISFLIIQNSFANTSWNSWYTTINEDSLNFSATLENWVVNTSWEQFTKSEDYWFSYYKIIRSNKKENPYYPEDGYIGYISKIENISFIDKKPFSWGTFYRVCAIAKDKWNYRFCSKVVYINNNYKEEQIIKKETKILKSLLSKELEKKLNGLFEKYVEKIAAKTDDNNKKIEIVQLIIKKLDSMDSTSSINKKVIDYLNNKFKEYKMILSDNIEGIDDIINDIIWD